MTCNTRCTVNNKHTKINTSTNLKTINIIGMNCINLTFPLIGVHLLNYLKTQLYAIILLSGCLGMSGNGSMLMRWNFFLSYKPLFAILHGYYGVFLNRSNIHHHNHHTIKSKMELKFIKNITIGIYYYNINNFKWILIALSLHSMWCTTGLIMSNPQRPISAHFASLFYIISNFAYLHMFHKI